MICSGPGFQFTGFDFFHTSRFRQAKSLIVWRKCLYNFNFNVIYSVWNHRCHKLSLVLPDEAQLKDKYFFCLPQNQKNAGRVT